MIVLYPIFGILTISGFGLFFWSLGWTLRRVFGPGIQEDGDPPLIVMGFAASAAFILAMIVLGVIGLIASDIFTAFFGAR